MMSPNVVEVTEANFQTEVIDFSRKAPVVIDFWATWCGPCRTLGPILEKLAEEYGGAFRLAKVDVDRSPQLAAAARVQSIPTVVAVFDGAFVDQFVGALPRAEVKRFVDGILERSGGSTPSEAAKAPADPERARRYWEAQLLKNEKDDRALLELGRLLIRRMDLERARALLERVEPTMDAHDQAQTSLQMVDLLGEVEAAGGESMLRDRLTRDPDDIEARYLVAVAEAGRGQNAEALEALVDLVAKGPAELRETAKHAARTVLRLAGRDDPQVETQRKRLASLLF